MSYPSYSGYYSSSSQPSNRNTNGFQPPTRTTNNHVYANSMGNLSNSTQQEPYNSSNYGWSGQSAYQNTAAEQTDETYQQSSDYGYQRDGIYSGQDTSGNISYPQDYYRRAQMRDQGEFSRQSMDGLNNLAYASGLETNSMPNRTRNAQHYEIQSSRDHNRVQSPIDSQSRYSTSLAPTNSSHPMRQQASSSSTSSNQLAMDAAAALAGAVGRRNASNSQHAHLNTVIKSPAASSRAAATPVTGRTVSPQDNVSAHPTQTYTSTPQQYQHQQHNSSQYASVSSQANVRQSPTSTYLNNQQQTAGSNNQEHISRQAYNTTSTPRSVRQTGSIANLVTAVRETEGGSQPETSDAPDPAPNFIDPTSIFDPYAQEREKRRQAAERAAIEAEIAARKKAEEDSKEQERKRQEQKEAAEVARQKKVQDEAEVRKKRSATKSTPISKGQGSERTSVVTTQTEEERMAAELKAMMEKMKAFQSKDPSLFKKLWDEMRKPATSAATVGVDTPSPQLTQQALPNTEPQQQELVHPQTEAPNQVVEKPRSKNRSKKPQKGPDGQLLHLNGYPVLVENNPEGLPDLGRFPAERRIRHPYQRKPSEPKESDEARKESSQRPVSSPVTPAQPVNRPSAAVRPTPPNTAQATPAALNHVFPPPADKTIGQTTLGSISGSSAGTVWPLEKRNALTSTALRTLRANPENANITLTEDDLSKILETNPSYLDLCQQLEAKGFKFHRAHFARELLNSVPDLKSGTLGTQPVPNLISTPGPPARSGGGAQTLPPTPSSQPRPKPLTWQQPYLPPQHGHPPPHGYPPQPYAPPTGQFVPPLLPPYGQGAAYPPPPEAANYSKMPMPKGYPRRPEPPSGPKEAAARKRDFSELIDLTDLGDDDNYVSPSMHPRLEEPDSGDEMGTEALEAYQKQRQVMPIHNHAPGGYLPPIGRPLPPSTQTGQNSKWEAFTDIRNIHRLAAKPLNKEEALKKQYYDPKTVARDILIATGRHPSERPLNVHLAGMLGRFIELDSDVNTFEWDDVDPSGPPAPKVEIADIPASKPRFKLGERIQKRSQKANGLTIIDKTRRPDKERRLLGRPSKNNLTSQTARNPGAVTPKSLLMDPDVKDAFRKPTSKLRQSLLATDEQATPARIDPTHPPQIESDRGNREPNDKGKAAMLQDVSVRRKPGRPPGSKNKFPSISAMKAQASDIKVNVPYRDATPTTKDRYKCKWKKCSTVLHNLDTLRKHIGRVHRPNSSDNEGYTCWWKKCKYLRQDETTGEWITTKTFDHWEDWLKHIEKEHVTPIAMRWGDGPATDHIDPPSLVADRKKYLADANGLETTPTLELANNHSYPPDTLNLTELDHRMVNTHNMTDKQKTDEAAYIAFMRAQGINLKKHEDSREASKEVLRSFAERKNKIGAGIDRGGCTLVTQAMRETFEQNPGIRRIING